MFHRVLRKREREREREGGGGEGEKMYYYNDIYLPGDFLIKLLN